MSDDENWREGDESTFVFEKRDWTRPVDDEPDESTRVLDAQQLDRALQARRSGKAYRRPSQGGSCREARLLDSRRARPYCFDQLPGVELREKRILDEFFSLLPPGQSMAEISAAIARRLIGVTGCSHDVRWIGVGTGGADSDLLAEFDADLWTWARVPPEHHRLFVGVSRPIADCWVGLVGPEPSVVGDDFEFGVTAFVVAQFCAELCRQAKWPPWTWAVNPMGNRDLQSMIGSGRSLRLELVFRVVIGEAIGTLRIVLPAPTLRQIGAACTGPVSPQTDQMARQWWSGLIVRRPLIVGTTVLRTEEFQGLSSGDVVMIDRHGVMSEETAESARTGGARWWIGKERAITGAIVDGPGRNCCFEITSETTFKSRQEAVMNDDSSGEVQEIGANVVPTAQMKLEVRLGSIEMELGDVARLQRGQVIACDKPLGGPVELIVGGACVGNGELVSVDGALGVRILSITAR